MADKPRDPNISSRIQQTIQTGTREGSNIQAPFSFGSRTPTSIKQWTAKDPYFISFTCSQKRGLGYRGTTFAFKVSDEFEHPGTGTITYQWSCSVLEGEATNSDYTLFVQGGNPNTTQNGRTATFSTTILGKYKITLAAEIVTDGGETITSTHEKTINVVNRAPLISSFSILPEDKEGFMDEEFSIETSITDPDGDSFTYSWSIIGDQYSPLLTGSGLSRTFSPPGPGRYKISVTATDEHGNEDTRSDFVNVTNRAPTFLSTPPVQTAVGGIATSEGDMFTTFQVSTVANDPDGLPLTYTWSIEGPSGVDGDPNLTPTGVDNGVEFIAPNAGEYTVSVVVSDGFDSISDSSSITVNNRIPSVSLSFSPSEPVRDETITLTATVIDEDKQNIDFTWTGFEFFTDFEVTSTTGPQEILTGVDSGKFRSQETIQFSLGEIQTKTIGVSITDGYASVSDSVGITIFNSLPGLTPTLSYPSEGNDFARPGVITSSTSVDSEGETVITYTNTPGKHALISVIKSDADEDDILTLEWALDSYDPTVDLLTSTDELDEFAFHSTNLGTRIITFTASDSIDTIHESIEFVVDTVGPTGIVIDKPFGGAAISNTRGSATNLQIDGGAFASHPDNPHVTLSTHSWSITSRPASSASSYATIEQPSDPSDFTSQARFLSYSFIGGSSSPTFAATGDYEITVTITDSEGNTSTDSVTITVS